MAPRRDAVMKRLVQVLEEQPEETPALSSLCAAIGVSRHSLNEICYDLTGMTVVKYVRDHRLGLVGQALLQADPRSRGDRGAR